jgi:hypothetical protein
MMGTLPITEFDTVLSVRKIIAELLWPLKTYTAVAPPTLLDAVLKDDTADIGLMVAATIFPLKKELPSYLPKVLTL